MPRLLRYALMLAVLLTAFATPLPIQGSTDRTAPYVVETFPAEGDLLPINGIIRIVFSEPMARDSLEAALTAPIRGRLDWEDARTVRFVMNAPLTVPRGEAYHLHINEQARSAEGVPLRQPFSLTLQTPGFFEAVQLIPANGDQNLSLRMPITVIFNRPVVPLMTAEEMQRLPRPFTLNPEPSGWGEWVSTSIYTFYPQLSEGTTYTLSLDPELRDMQGNTLREALSITFTTVAAAVPKVGNITPRDKQNGILPSTRIAVGFNQPMNRASVEAAFRLIAPDGLPISGTFQWQNNYTAIFKPATRLDYDGIYRVQVAKGALSVLEKPTAEDFISHFEVISPPRLTAFTPVNGSVVTPSQGGGLQFRFTAPMPFKAIRERITITPKPPLDRIWESAGELGFNYTYNFVMQAGTRYTATLDLNGLTDIYGTPATVTPDDRYYTVLEDNKVQVQFLTTDIAPSFSLQTNSLNGLYSAYSEPVRVYVTHRNIETIKLQLWKLQTADLLRLNSPSQWKFRQNFAPRPEDFLRQWVAPVYNPPNVVRYDLLAIALEGEVVGQTGNVQCVEAAPSRLQVGMTALVSKDTPDDPFRLRNVGGLNSVITHQVPDGTRLKVLEGPLCADRFVWWRLQSEDGAFSGWGAEGDRTRPFISPAEGEQPTQYGKLPPGAYWLALSSPQITHTATPAYHMMIVATANLLLKTSPNEIMAWVTDMQSGAPLAKQRVRFYQGEERSLIGEATSDAQGIARLPYALKNLHEEIFAVLQTDEAFGLGYSLWSEGILPHDFNLNANFDPIPLEVYIDSDRPLYRPGETVHFRGVLRESENYTLAGIERVRVEVRSVQYKAIYTEELPVNEFGAFNGSLSLASDTSLGNYMVSITVPNGTQTWHNYPYRLLFTVAEYRTPEIQARLTATQPEVARGDKIEMTLQSSYFFGGAPNKAAVRWTAVDAPYYFRYTGKTPYSYSFRDRADDEGFREQARDGQTKSVSGQGVSDDKGKFTFEVPAALNTRNESIVRTVEASLRDASDQEVSARAQVIVHQGAFYIGVASERYVGMAGTPQRAHLIAVDWKSTPLPEVALNVRVMQRIWRSTQSVEISTGRTVWENVVEEVLLSKGALTTAADGTATFDFTPKVGGVYKIYAEGRDANGNQITASAYVWIASSRYVNWRQQNSNRLELRRDKDSYSVGDVAEILIANPFQGEARALITVERRGVLQTEVITINGSHIHKLPITADFAPNAFVSVTLSKGVDETNFTPAFRMGMIPIFVERDQLRLNVEITPSVADAHPRDPIRYTIRVTDYSGKPIRAELSAALIDAAVLSLMPEDTPDLLDYFYGEQRLSVRTANALINSVEQRTQEILNVIKGGGGGGSPFERGVIEVRANFLSTAFWQPSVVTDAEGYAKLSLTLPDNLTTWRLDVRAVSAVDKAYPRMLVGQATHDLIASKALLVRPVTPRFFTVEDELVIGAVVNNNTDQPQRVRVRLEQTGLTISTPLEQESVVAPNSQARFNWSAVVQDVEWVDLTFYAINSDETLSDAAKPAVGLGAERLLPVRRYFVPEVTATGGMIGGEGGALTEGIAIPSRYIGATGTLTVRLDRSLAAAALDALKVLEGFPHECIEQTVSRFLPNAATYRALSQLGVNDPALRRALEDQLSQAMQRLYAAQSSDGGWGWFRRDRSDPQVTAYVLLGMLEAERVGFSVSADVMLKATEFLLRAFREKRLLSEGQAVFTAYVLVQRGALSYSDLVPLFEERHNLLIYAKAYLALAFHTLKPDDAAYVPRLLDEIMRDAQISANGASWRERADDYFSWSSDTRTTAIVLLALARLKSDHPLIPNVLRWLMMRRTTAAWETTQETTWAVLAFAEWLAQSGELKARYGFTLRLNGADLVADGQATPQNVREALSMELAIADLLANDLNRLQIEREEGGGTLYYTAYLRATLPADQVSALDRGFAITRTYSLADDPDGKPITSAKVGDLIRVTLDISVRNDVRYVAITDPLPAGTESVDARLLTNRQEFPGSQPLLTRWNTRSDGFGWWWFSNVELRDDRTVLYASYLPRGGYRFSYTIRAGMAGTFKVIPTTGEAFYFPEVYGRSDGMLFEIAAAAAVGR
jgi:uncharacterized protein YfaS (alpha-2-macroglobulin family)